MLVQPNQPGVSGNVTDNVAIFLHGRGQGSESASAVVDAFPYTDFIAPDGGVELRRGRTWFLNREIGVAQPESVADARSAFLLWFRRLALGDRHVWLCGFSNGGAFAAHLLLQHPELFKGAALLCAPLVLPPWRDGSLVGKSVFYAHGDHQDTVVPQAFFLAGEEYLERRSGSDLTIKRYQSAHVITAEMVSDLSLWFRRVRAPRDCGSSQLL